MYRMMIVDDEEIIVNSLYGMIHEHFDLEIHRAYSGLEAQRLLGKMRFDLILSDISMPQVSGLELLEAAKRLWPQCHFILLTAYNNFDYAYQAIKYDRVDYILKLESYDVIRETIEKKIALLEEERRARERLPELAGDAEEIRASITRYFLKRMIVQGMALPDQKDLEAVKSPIRLASPALLAMAMVKAESLPDQEKIMLAAREYVQNQLKPYQLELLSYYSGGRSVWVIQETGESAGYTREELVLFVQDALNSLFQMQAEDRRQSLALLCCEQFVPWRSLHGLYQRALIALERVRDESSMVLLPCAEEIRDQPPTRFPTLDELNMLWDALKHGQRETFLLALSQGLTPLKRLEEPPAASRAAISLLFTEALNLYGARETDRIKNALQKQYKTGGAWVEDVLQAAGELFTLREMARQDTEIWLIRQIDEYLEAHFTQDVTLTSLAEVVHYNPSYLSRFYKQHTGKNIMARLYEVRIDHARRLLLQTGMKAGEISARCGFCSTKYFNQVFKKAAGCSPLEYRQRMKNENE